MVGLVDDAFLLLFPGSIRSPQCAQRVTATRSRLLVCLPYHTEPHQEALSRTNRDGDPCALRESGSAAQHHLPFLPRSRQRCRWSRRECYSPPSSLLLVCRVRW